MGPLMSAYTIAFEGKKGNKIANRSILSFLKKIESVMNKSPELIIRKINSKIIRVHAYEWNTPAYDYVVVPVGKLKEKNKPLASDPETQKLVNFKQDMFDVTMLAYHPTYNIALLSTNAQGPRDEDIEEYLNSFLPLSSEYIVKLTPIKRDIALTQIRNAKQANSITLSLDIGRPLNNFLVSEINEDVSITRRLYQLVEMSKTNLSSNKFELTLGIGRKKGSLDVNALIELLDSINLDAQCIKEITVNYKNNLSEKIDTAKLKENSAILKFQFPTNKDLSGPEFILDNMGIILQTERSKYYTQVHEKFKGAISIGDDYEIVEQWSEEPTE